MPILQVKELRQNEDMHSCSHNTCIWKSLRGGQRAAFLDAFTLVKNRRNGSGHRKAEKKVSC